MRQDKTIIKLNAALKRRGLLLTKAETLSNASHGSKSKARRVAISCKQLEKDAI